MKNKILRTLVDGINNPEDKDEIRNKLNAIHAGFAAVEAEVAVNPEPDQIKDNPPRQED